MKRGIELCTVAVIMINICIVYLHLVNGFLLFLFVFVIFVYFSIARSITSDSPLTALDIMENGSIVAAGTTRGKIYIYDLRTGESPIKEIQAHKTAVRKLSFQNTFKNAKVCEILTVDK